MTEGYKAGHRRVTVGGGHQAKGPSCGVGGCGCVGELAAGTEGNDLGGVRQCGIGDD